MKTIPFIFGLMMIAVSANAEILKFKSDGSEERGVLKIMRVLDDQRNTGAFGELDCKKKTLTYAKVKYHLAEVDCAHALVMLNRLQLIQINAELAPEGSEDAGKMMVKDLVSQADSSGAKPRLQIAQ